MRYLLLVIALLFIGCGSPESEHSKAMSKAEADSLYQYNHDMLYFHNRGNTETEAEDRYRTYYQIEISGKKYFSESRIYGDRFTDLDGREHRVPIEHTITTEITRTNEEMKPLIEKLVKHQMYDKERTASYTWNPETTEGSTDGDEASRKFIKESGWGL